MKRTTIFLSILFLFLQGTSLFATDIRGQIVKYNAYYKTYEPLLNIKIGLYQNNQHIKTTYTNAINLYNLRIKHIFYIYFYK